MVWGTGIFGGSETVERTEVEDVEGSIERSPRPLGCVELISSTVTERVVHGDQGVGTAIIAGSVEDPVSELEEALIGHSANSMVTKPVGFRTLHRAF